jgi:GrpB-like predicted nucleotidyltransferase (UPF0157 family)
MPIPITKGCSKIDRMTRFRDWLRDHPEDLELYAAEKRMLAQREWKYVQNYADAKTAVIDQIIARATRASTSGLRKQRRPRK